MPQTTVDLSIIIPCYNSGNILEEELPLLINVLCKSRISYEIIVSDDGSEPEDIAQKIATQYSCLYTSNQHNIGKGEALRKGFELASGQVQLFTDCDLPFAFDAILMATEIIKNERADIVIGDRTLPASSYYLEISWLRKLGSYLISSIASRILKNNIVDTQCGFKAFSNTVANQLFRKSIVKRFGIDFELLYLASMGNMHIEKIPVQLRTQYPSSVKVYKDGIRIIAEIISTIRHHGKKAKR